LHLHRDIYYTDSQLFGNQAAVDSAIDDISCMLKVPRRSLHVVSHSKYKTLPQNEKGATFSSQSKVSQR
jgi:DNA topoisomerase VI subunit A